MPRLLAPATSIVLYPAPARTMSDRRPASSMGDVTFVPRTTRTSAPLAAIASVSASSLSSGSCTTSQPAAFRPSMPLFSNLSATSTFIHRSRLVSYCVNQQAVTELGLEPGRLGRHDAPIVGD